MTAWTDQRLEAIIKSEISSLRRRKLRMIGMEPFARCGRGPKLRRNGRPLGK